MSEHKKKKHKHGKSKESKEVKELHELDGKKKTKPAKKSVTTKTVRSAKPRTKKASGATKRKMATGAEPGIHFETISLRAYFLSENRQIRGEHGDEHGDWHEAERQLREEGSPDADPQS